MSDLPLPPDPPQHLLGGLNVAIVLAPGSSGAQLDTARSSLEELGVNVLVVAARRGSVPVAGDVARHAAVSQAAAVVDPDSLDGVLVLADGGGARQLAADEQVRGLLVRVHDEGKPVGAVAEGLLPLLRAGLLQDRTASIPEPLAQEAGRAGAVAAGEMVAVDSNIVTLAEPWGLDAFTAHLKQLLAQRRLATISPGNDISSAVGEDG